MGARSLLLGISVLFDQAEHLHLSYYERDILETEVEFLDIYRNPCNTVFSAGKQGILGESYPGLLLAFFLGPASLCGG